MNATTATTTARPTLPVALVRGAANRALQWADEAEALAGDHMALGDCALTSGVWAARRGAVTAAHILHAAEALAEANGGEMERSVGAHLLLAAESAEVAASNARSQVEFMLAVRG